MSCLHAEHAFDARHDKARHAVPCAVPSADIRGPTISVNYDTNRDPIYSVVVA